MTLHQRFQRYIYHQNWSGTLTYLIGFGIALWFARRPIILAILIVLSLLTVVLVYLLRHAILNRYPAVMRVLNRGAPVVLIGLVAFYFLGWFQIAVVLYGLYAILLLVMPFWCTSDPMYEMLIWLAFPTEWGRWPDEIKQIDTRRMPWPGRQGGVRCCLFRYRYGSEWETGITGPVTFSLGEQDFEGQAPEAIYEAYASWYQAESPSARIQPRSSRL